jgi:hypothetical protein
MCWKDGVLCWKGLQMNLRADYPDHAAFIDAMRESFGKEGIDTNLRAGMQGIPGKFCLRDLAGNVIAGTPAAAARVEFTAAEIVIESQTRNLIKNATRR